MTAPDLDNSWKAQWRAWCSTCFGLFLGLALLKFGNPVILDRLIDPPKDVWEWIFQPWPVRWGYVLLLLILGFGLPGIQLSRRMPKWVLLLPFVWLLWQAIAATWTIDAPLTKATLLHFGACVVCFYLGAFGLTPPQRGGGFQFGLMVAFALVLWTGFEQHYGGLEATRKMFYDQPNWQQSSPDFLKKIQSDRIFSTLVYPNALATAILLLLPLCLLTVWKTTRRLTDPSRAVIVGVVGYAAVACLFWSGSKSGWLIALVQVLAMVLRHPFSRQVKVGIVTMVLALGLTGFFVKNASYFRRGATSVSARFDYWRAALDTAVKNPIVGTGPGTFSVAYRQIKPPEAEMAQLTHNDYLEQASDSGLLGFLAYAGFVLGSVLLLPRSRGVTRPVETFVIWLGLLGWSLQSFVEFPLYIPALGWTAFTFLGWLWNSPIMGSTGLPSIGRLTAVDEDSLPQRS